MDRKALISLLDRSKNISIDTESISVNMECDTLILITAAGQITGKLLREKDGTDLKDQVANTIFLSAADAAAKYPGEDSFILLKDAVLKTFGCDIRYRYLYVFTDDIIAATVGKLNVD